MDEDKFKLLIEFIFENAFRKGYKKGIKKGKSIGSHQAYDYFIKRAHWEDAFNYYDAGGVLEYPWDEEKEQKINEAIKIMKKICNEMGDDCNSGCPLYWNCGAQIFEWSSLNNGG